MASLLEKIKSEKIVILPIYGIGGIGKTTLAKLIYNDTNLKYFSHVWVCVSQRLSPEKIRKSIISKLSGSENQTIEQLTSKEILIVLDDLWEDKPLKIEKLKDILSPRDSTKKVIVLVTTRSEDIAKKICCNIDEPYQIKSLTDQMCWDIIKQKTFFESIPEKEKLEDIGKKIAQKCRGVALAAQTLGSMLHSMEYNRWIKVRDNSIWNGNVSKDASLPQHVLASLKLSYDLSLDDSLKKCFTYCAIFPKGYSIVKSDLIYQWISLDFIKPSKMLSTLQLCEKYIVRLLGLSFLEHYSVSQTTHGVYGEHDTVFTMHDLVHDLAVSLLGDKILDQSNQDNTGGSSCCYALLAGCRKPLESCMTSPARLSALRFLRCLMTELHGAAFEPAESLRVLDLSECEIQTLPDSIGQLKQLRYLKAPGIKYRMVPECIMKLTKLQYLNLANCKNIGVLPNDFIEWQYLNLPTEIEFSGSLHLTKLKYLNLASRDDIIRLSEALSGLTGLKYLNLSHHFIRGELLASFLGNLCDLVHLDLSYCYSLGDRPAALNGLTKLQYLNLSRSCCFDAIEGLQEVFGDLSELRDLNLGCCIERISSSHPAKINDLLGRICTLTNLESLSLRENNNIYSIPESLGNLRKLHTLDLSYCRSLQRLPASISKIHSLKCLKTKDCWMLDRSTLPQYKRSSKTSSHIGLPSQSDYEIPDRVKILSSPENVEKTNITGLTLEWTRDEKRFVDDDPEVLRELDKRYSVSEFHLEGYSISFLSWMMHLDAYLPGLTSIHMSNIPNCNILPPLGQLLNLKLLKVTGMDNIKKIDMDLYGGTRAFPRLEEFRIDGMKCLEEWNTAYPSEVFPCLRYVGIRQCPRLRFKPSPPRSKDLRVYSSHEVLLSSCGNSGNVGASATTRLYVECCVVPLHQWTLLLHLPRLEHLWIVNCSDLTCSSPNFLRDLTSLQTLTVRGCESIGSLPERLGDLTSLLELEIRDCKGIKTLPDSIQQLTRLQILTMQDCESIASLPEPLGGLSSLTQLGARSFFLEVSSQKRFLAGIKWILFLHWILVRSGSCPETVPGQHISVRQGLE